MVMNVLITGRRGYIGLLLKKIKYRTHYHNTLQQFRDIY